MAEVTDDGGRTKEAVATRDWSELMPVCLTNVFRRLTLEDRWKGTMLVSRSWRDASRDPSLFAALNLEPMFEFTGSFLSDYAEWWTPAFQRRVDAMLRSAALWAEGSLQEIRVRHCSDDSLRFAAERSPNLQILSIKSSQSVTDRSIFKIASSCPMLVELDITNCYKVSFKSLEVVGKECPNLKVLKRNLSNWFDPSQDYGIVPNDYLRICSQDGDREAMTIAKFMPKLKHVELCFSKLSDRGLISLSEGCGDLELLNLSGCPNLTSREIAHASANLKNLKTLIRPKFHTRRFGHWRFYD